MVEPVGQPVTQHLYVIARPHGLAIHVIQVSLLLLTLFLPEASFALWVLQLPPSVCVCVSLYVRIKPSLPKHQIWIT